MIVCIADLLSPADLGGVVSLLEKAAWDDGAKTAGWHAKTVKANQQLKAGPAADEIRSVVQASLARNDIFQAAALPRRVGSTLISRYESGMTYGDHVDDAVMGVGEARLRADIAVTVFLSAPETYEGGALIVNSTGGEADYKLAAGSAIVYPATTLHRVSPVTSGVRLAAVFWVQSLVRDADKREMLFDLDRAKRSIFAREGKSETFDLVAKSHANLLRQWVDV
jgi:PKHD-type hydroxylase